MIDTQKKLLGRSSPSWPTYQPPTNSSLGEECQMMLYLHSVHRLVDGPGRLWRSVFLQRGLLAKRVAIDQVFICQGFL